MNLLQKVFIIFRLLYKEIIKDPNANLVKVFIRQYLIDHNLHPGLWELHYIDVETKKHTVIIKFILGRPAQLIGTKGETIDNITTRLTQILGKHVTPIIIEFNYL